MSHPYFLNVAVVSAFGASGILLADSAIKGAALLVIASIVALALRRDSAATRHWVWLIAIVALLLVPLMSAVLPQWRVLPAWTTMSQTGYPSNAAAIANSTENVSSVAGPAVASAPATHSGAYDPTLRLPADASAEQVATQPAASINASTSSQAVVNGELPGSWLRVVPLCWAIGVAALLMRLIAARVLLWHSQRRSVVINSLCTHASDLLLCNTFHDACLHLGIRKSITLLIHPQKTIPVVWGILRHRLLLPEVARQWSEEQLRSVLLHELAHIKRRDALSQLLAQTACALHWFNPLVWFAAWRLHVERERACDDLVLASGIRASAYAEHLLDVATRLTSSPWNQACGLAMARSSSLQSRLDAVLNAGQNRRKVTSALLAFLFVASAAIAVPVAMMSSAVEAVASDPAEPVNASDATSLPAGLEQHLEWSDPTGGLRAALMIRSVESPGKLGKERKIFLVIQNVSHQPIRYCDAEIHETKVPAADVEGRKLYLKDNGEIMFALQHALSTQTDIVLKPRGVHIVDMFESEQEKARDLKTGDLMAEGIIKVPTEALFAVLKIAHAPEGAWTGKLTTPTTRGAFAAEGKMPSSQEGQALFRYCIDHARLNGEIPGGLIGRLHDLVLEFIRLNTGDQFGDPYAKKMQPLLARFEKKGDWKQADAVSLFDEITAVTTIPLERTMNAIRENSLQRGQALPNSLKDANWGEVLPGGLRLAWVLEPREKQVHLGSSLKSRVVLHNAGQESVIFVTRNFHQPEHKAVSASGAAMQMDSTYWTTIGRPEPYRLRPGESCEVYAPGIGVGTRNNATEDWSNVRAGTWILASEGNDVTFQPGAIKLTGDHNGQIDPDWWLKFITERVNRDAPIPADAKEREVILFRVISDLFGGSPTPEEASEFLSDNSPDAASNLAKRLSTRNWYKSISGSITSGEVKFHVLPIDPNVATRPRVTMNPGHYNLGDEMRFVVSRRPVGERIVNEADIVWYPAGKDNVPTKVPLPNDYDTWAAGWAPNSTVLWVSQKGLLRSYDFTHKTAVKETRYEGEQIATAPIPTDVRDALRVALEKAVPQQKPAAKPPAALAPAAPPKQSNNARPPVAEPKSELSKSIMEEWRKVARSDGKIPGATVSALESAVKEFSTNFPKFTTILSRFDSTRDWTVTEAIALLDAVTEIESLPINSLINEYRFSKPANMRMGKPLPAADLANVVWGKPLTNGLRSALLIEPQAKEYALGSVVKARVLIQNSGKNPVTFLFPRHAMPDGVRVSSAQIHIVPWTYAIHFVRVRLDPGHYIEEDSFDVAIEDHFDDQAAHARVVIEAKSGSEFHLSFVAELTEKILRQPDGLTDPEAIRLRTIANRVAEEAPLPASAADREMLLRHVVLDMFGEPPTADEIAEFVRDNSPGSLTKLIARLQTRTAADAFVGEILSGEVTIRTGSSGSLTSSEK